MTSPFKLDGSSVNKNTQTVEQLNRSCQDSDWVESALKSTLEQQGCGGIYQMLIEQCPHLFSGATVFVTKADIDKQISLIQTINNVIELPSYQDAVLAYAPDVARYRPKAKGVFLGYDFHVGSSGSKLIEINTNAGGALLNALLVQTSSTKSNALTSPAFEQVIFDMFKQEWQAERGLQPLQTIAIVDENPAQQYLLPEFMLFAELFKRQGLQAIICDPAQLVFKQNALWHEQTRIDLVYNRHTDFGFETPALQALASAYLAGAVVVTPHPHAHALYADKRNLVILSDQFALEALGVDAASCAILQDGIATTHQVKASDAGALWAGRKHLFFKPAKGFGSKAAYRGDKLTQRVFAEILQGTYVAQKYAPPGLRQLDIQGQLQEFKWDLRHYAYQQQIQLLVARLYQGQTTNFRTLGGGFARVAVVSEQI